MAKLKNIFKPAISWINKNGTFRPLLRSRLVLYFIFILSLFNLYSFSMNSHDNIYAAIFILVGYLTTFFSKNMIVILVCALAISNILKYGLEIRLKPASFGTEAFTANGEDNGTETDKDENGDTKSKPTTDNATKTDTKAMTDSKVMTDGKAMSLPDTNNIAEMKGHIEKSLDEIKTDKSTVDPDKKKDYKNILELNLKLLGKVTEMQPLLKEAQDAMHMMKSM